MGSTKDVVTPKPAAARAPVEVTVPLVGLTKENAAKAEEALKGLTVKAYTCSSCQETHAKPGSCPGCDAPLAAKDIKPLENVKAAADRGTMAFKIQGGVCVGLAQVDTALSKSSLKVDREKLQVRGPVLIAISGAKDAEEVEKALVDSKLFANVETMLDSSSHQVHAFVQTSSSAPTLSDVSMALEKQPGWKVSDVIWGASGLEKAG